MSFSPLSSTHDESLPERAAVFRNYCDEMHHNYRYWVQHQPRVSDVQNELCHVTQLFRQRLTDA